MDLQLARAVHVLNHDVLSCNRVAANQWLVQFQQTDAAWEVATTILTAEAMPMQDFEVEMFAAQILKRKIQSDMTSLQPDGRSALQNALLLAASRYSTGPPQLLTQICLALSALMLRSPESQKLTEHLFNSLFGIQYQGSASNAVIELLTVLPEEVSEQRTMNAGMSDRRREFSHELLRNSFSVLEFLAHMTDTEVVDHQKRSKILRCLLSWIRIGCFLEVDQSSVPTHPLIGFSLTSLQAPGSFDIAIEVLSELINQHEMVPPTLLRQIVSVKETLLLPALATRNENVVKGLSLMMTELGQAAPNLIAQGSPEALALTDALLRCVTYKSSSWEIAESSLPFWSAFGDCILASTQPGSQNEMASAIYSALLDAFIARVQVGPCTYSEDDVDVSSGLPDGLAQFRVNLEETLLTVCRILGPTQYVTQLLNCINPSLEFTSLWQVLEAQFFLLYTAAEIILEGPRLDLSSLVNVLLARSVESLPGLNLLHRSAAQVVGAFARWICNHPTAVLALLSFLASGLSVPLAASACATSIRRVCEEVSLMSSEPANLDCLLWIGEGLHKLKLSFKEEEEVLCAIGRALLTVSSSVVLHDALHRVLKPAYEALESLLVADASEYVVYDSGIRSLHRLGIIFSHLPALCLSNGGDQEILFSILAQFWPLLERLMASRYMENNGLAVATCKCFSEAIQAGGPQLRSLLPNVVKALSENFLSFQTHICFIKLATSITEEFGSEKECGHLFIELLRIFSTAEVVASLNSTYACDQEPEVAEAYMSFMCSFLRNCPKEVIVVGDVHLEACLNKATICCTVMHRGAALSAMSFITCFLDCTMTSRVIPECSSLLRICSANGESIVSGMLYALLGPSAMSRVYKATTVLQQLAALCQACDRNGSKYIAGWSSLQCWIVSAIQALPSEYLRQGEADVLSATWLGALRAAAADFGTNKGSSSVELGYLNGDGGRSLKRILREFADQHRMSSSICVS